MFIQDYKRLQFVNPDRYPRRFAIIALTPTTQTFQRPRRMDHSLEVDANSSRSGVCSRSSLMVGEDMTALFAVDILDLTKLSIEIYQSCRRVNDGMGRLC